MRRSGEKLATDCSAYRRKTGPKAFEPKERTKPKNTPMATPPAIAEGVSRIANS